MIIDSLLDTDLYKFTMMQVVLHHFPAAEVEYRFRCRTPGVELAPLLPRIDAELDALCSLRFTPQELDYLRGLRFIKSDFIDFLELFRLNRSRIHARPADDPQARARGEIDITIRGPWLHTILFEVPVLAIVGEVWATHVHAHADQRAAMSRLDGKIAQLRQPGLEGCRIADYGTRRRYSGDWQRRVLERLRHGLGEQLAGTSNVALAREMDLVPLGTMAHEYLQACQALGPRLRDTQVFGFETWAREYRGDLGIALADVYGLQAFLRDFDLYFCKLFDGARHDSGDPFAWTEQMIAHYSRHRVDPRGKTLVYSDSLTTDKVEALYRRFHERVGLAFGIGTHLMHDVGHAAPQMVIKMVRCNGQPVAKITDDPGKNMCDDPAYLAYLREVFQISAPTP
ncbi:MAG: nicotinate phosphoribosyltransferase [Betaproteobacteria bacterium]|uniref:nicotinate phosphoribosyltransferase n=1 Tax=Thiomonas sp. FB-6 TaxID=1158291 RepID=UPI000363A7E2|nr:nicotinate phosphoribosyltransferase [Thiomonas sp. FB-6]MBU6510753.1 nicotinate phosphoribosyltransferase [Betaproteobacteria bacterium]MDE1956956.1 nicotinate phosphoribosyltransferase [Betaproteobacteria bacterium]MDE2151755.1 nicotinate phosphoribosyltransferase [Betaproteobacteria bacterium]